MDVKKQDQGHRDHLSTSGSGAGGTGSVFLERFITHFEEIGVVVALSLMTVLYTLSIISRYITKISVPWAEELVRFCFMWAIFLGASIGVKRNAHLGVSALYASLPAKWQKYISVVITACCVFTCGLLALKGLDMVHLQFRMGQRSSQLGVPIFMVGLAVPVGLLLCLIRFLQAIFLKLKQ